MKNKRSNHEDEGEYVRERKRGVLKSGEKECPEGRRERESPEIKKGVPTALKYLHKISRRFLALSPSVPGISPAPNA